MCLTVVTIANMATTLAARCFIWQHYDVIANFVDLDNKAHFEQLVLYFVYDEVDAPPTKVTIPLQSSTFEDDMLDIVNELGAFTISMFAEVKASMNVRAHEHPDNSEVEKSIVADTTVGVPGWLWLSQGSASSTSMTDASAENVDKFDIHIGETNARLLTTQIGPVLRPSCHCHHLQASDCSDNVTLIDNIDPVLMDHDHESMSVLCEQPPSDGGWTLCNMEDTSIEPPPTPPSPSPLATPPPPPSQALSPPVAPPMASPNADIPASPPIWMAPKHSCDPAPPPQASPPVDEEHTAPATRRFRKLRTTILHNHDVITVQRTTRQLTISVAGKSPMGGWAGDIGWRAMHKHPIPHNNELGHILGAYSVHDLNNGRLILSTQNRKGLERLERYALHALFLHHQENRAHTGVFLLDELAKWFQDFKPLEDHDLIII